MGIIHSSFRKLGSFLQDNTYYIPEYQRGYSWEEEQLFDYWDDLIQLFNEGERSSHFLGQIVVHYNKEEEKRYIIDGQQRTSTSIILLDAIRSVFLEFNTQDSIMEAGDLTSHYIGRYTPDKNKLKLVLGEKDNQFFRNYIQLVEKKIYKKSALSKSELRIFEASNYFVKNIKEFLSTEADNLKKYNKLYKLYSTMVENFSVMYVETDEINEAFIIFETLNARGKELETSDLLKNHVFRISNKKIENVKSEWSMMLENLGKIDSTKFIRHYWNSKHSFVREKSLYKELRKNVTNPVEAEELVQNLAELARLYSALNSPEENLYFNNSELNEKVKEMSHLGAVSYYPIILAMENQQYNENDIYDVLTAIESLVVRNFVVAGKVANRYELDFAKIAYQISNEILTSKEEIVTEIKRHMISDDEFKSSFRMFTVKKKPVVRYLYRAINNYSNKETRIINDNSKIHIEHIMPQKLGNWNIIKEDHEEYLSKFGNQTLLGEEYNKNATNKEFSYKKDIYSKSQIKLTRDLSKLDKWDINSIKKRQEELADIAVEIWKK